MYCRTGYKMSCIAIAGTICHVSSYFGYKSSCIVVFWQQAVMYYHTGYKISSTAVLVTRHHVSSYWLQDVIYRRIMATRCQVLSDLATEQDVMYRILATRFHILSYYGYKMPCIVVFWLQYVMYCRTGYKMSCIAVEATRCHALPYLVQYVMYRRILATSCHESPHWLQYVIYCCTGYKIPCVIV